MIPQDPHALRGTRGQRSTLGTANLSPLFLPHWGRGAISGVAAEFLTKACSLPVTVMHCSCFKLGRAWCQFPLMEKFTRSCTTSRCMRTRNQGSLHHVTSRQHSLPSKLWALLKVKENFAFLLLYSLLCSIESLACRRFQLWKNCLLT